MRWAGAECTWAVQQAIATCPTTPGLATKTLHKIAALQCQRILRNSISRDSQLFLIYTFSFTFKLLFEGNL